MDALAQAWFETKFELLFHKARGDAFQQLLGRIMSMAYPGDFVQTRPWGKLGDEKCDGYLRSQRRFFQCYAPNELSQRATLAKLKEDFEGAAPQAEAFFDWWVFAHNAEDGRIPTWLVKELDRLQADYPKIRIDLCGYEELRKIVMSLPKGDLVALLGPPITQQAMLSLGFTDLQPLLQFLGRAEPVSNDVPHPVPADKLSYNALGANVEVLLKAGMTKSALVRQYLARGINKELGMRVAGAFKKEYKRLAGEQMDAVEIFDSLRRFAVGPCGADARSDVASLAVLAYLFEECDIFENPEEARQ
jgi:hypothetical protein